MQKYYYLVEAHGRQVLVRKGESEEELPAIQLVTHTDDGAELSFGFNFEPKGDKPIEVAEADRDRAFENEEELRKMAEGFAEKLVGCATGFDAMKALHG